MGKTIIVKYNTETYSIKILIKLNFCVFMKFNGHFSFYSCPQKILVKLLFLDFMLLLSEFKIIKHMIAFSRVVIEYEKDNFCLELPGLAEIRQKVSYCWFFLIPLPPLLMKNLCLMPLIHPLSNQSHVGLLQPL